MDKKNILICGLPNNVLRIFIENLSTHYNIFFISYGSNFQYIKIKEILGKNVFSIDSNSPVNLLRFVFISLKTISRDNIKIFVAFHNHFIKNGINIFLIKCFFPQILRIYFPYDIALYAIPKQLKKTLRGKLALFFDKMCFAFCHKVITKGFKDELKFLEDTYKIQKKPHFAFNFLIERKDTVDRIKKILKKDGKIHLVLIGAVKNPELGDNNYIVIKELLKEKNIVLHVYAYGSELLGDLKDNNNLVIHPYVENHGDLIKEISKYDFGISLSLPVQSGFIQARMASGIRLYDYLSAGLPIIIDNEHTSMANIIKKNKFGIVIPLKDVKNIMNYIKECDYNSLISFVKENRERYYLDKNIEKLTMFLEK